MSTGYRITASTGIHKGDREYQQDQVNIFVHPRDQGCLLAVVADGMGGRSGGRKASDQVLLTAKQLFERYAPAYDAADELLAQLLKDAHLVIKLTAISSEQEPHSTLAAFLINPKGDCHWIHSGDSRIYHFRGKRLVSRSLDHSFVQDLVRQGVINEEQARNHPKSNLLLGCLGTEKEPPIATHRIDQLQAGDVLMACSDGVWHYFSDQELASVLDALPPREASEFLITKARVRAAGKGDNLSLAIVKFSDLPLESGLESPPVGQTST